MLRVAAIVSVIFTVGACKSSVDNGDQPTMITGAVEKGPFVLGSSVSLSPVSAQGQPTGETFNTQTNDDAGRFSVEIVGTTGPASIEGSGFYYNEVLGRLSSAPIILRAFAEISDAANQTVFLNVITHMSYNRVQDLVSAGSAAFPAARAQAEGELVATLGIGGAGYSPGRAANQMSLLGGDDEANAYLFVASATLAQAALTASPQSVDATLQELMNTIAADLADDGDIAAAIKTQLTDAQQALDPDQILADLAARAAAIGSDTPLPNPHQVLDSDADGITNDDDNCPFVDNALQTDTDSDGVGDDCECGNSNLDYGEQCDDGNLVDTDDCSNDCELGFCADISGGSLVCEESEQCPTDHTCRRDLDTSTGCCVGGTGCGSSGECDPGSVCIESECKKLCASFADCDPGETCDESVCVSNACGASDDCDPGEICLASFCRRVCLTNDHCLTGEACVDDVCQPDADRDGIADDDDNCPGNANPTQSDRDMDGLGDDCDDDIDGDTVLNGSDNCVDEPNVMQINTDGDSEGDACDSDDDNDGTTDVFDDCRLGTAGTDVCDDDADGDGIDGSTDNCPGIYNPQLDTGGNQLDIDQDGIGDVCDIDMDGDTVENWGDNCIDVANPNQEDADGDGLGDVCDL